MGMELAEAPASMEQVWCLASHPGPLSQRRFDASLLGLAGPSATPEGDVRMLAQVLLAASPGSPEASAFEAALQRAVAARSTAGELGQMLETLRQAPAQQDAEVEWLEPQLEGHTLSRWKVERVLGEGAMAKVYLATDTRTGGKVALKVLKQEHLKEPEYVHRFVQEVRAVTAIANEHIVKVTDFGDECLPDGRRCVYCVMEMLEGMELAQAINQGPFSLERAVKLCRQLCGALHAAHQVGVVHRDVKPENIFLITRRRRTSSRCWTSASPAAQAIGDPQVGTKAASCGPPSMARAAMVLSTPEWTCTRWAFVLYELLSGSLPSADTFGQMLRTSLKSQCCAAAKEPVRTHSRV